MLIKEETLLHCFLPSSSPKKEKIPPYTYTRLDITSFGQSLLINLLSAEAKNGKAEDEREYLPSGIPNIFPRTPDLFFDKQEEGEQIPEDSKRLDTRDGKVGRGEMIVFRTTKGKFPTPSFRNAFIFPSLFLPVICHLADYF